MSVLKYSMVRTVEVATTYNQKYYDIIGKQMVESFVKHWPKHVKLHVYWQEAEPEIMEDNIVYHELYKVQPQLKQWVDQHTDKKFHGWRDDRNKHSTADILLYSDADTLYHAEPDLDYLSDISPADSLCTFFDRPKFRDETGFYMHNPRHPRAKEWANRLEEIYLSGEVWTYEKDRAADQYTMAFGRDSFKDCKQMDLMMYHEGVDTKDPVPTSPLNKFLQHLKGDKKTS
jgi:hypothetical protein